MKFSQNYGHLSAICFHCFTRFVKQILADFLLLFLRCRRTLHKKRVFERYAHIVSGFATISSCPVRDNAHHARVYCCARCGAPTRPGASAFALQKCVEPFSLQGSKSAIVHHILPKMTFPCRFRRHGVLSVRRFVGTEFCRRRKTRPLFRVFYREIRLAIRARRLKRLFLPLFRALPRASFLPPSAGVFRKIRAVFAL